MRLIGLSCMWSNINGWGCWRWCWLVPGSLSVQNFPLFFLIMYIFQLPEKFCSFVKIQCYFRDVFLPRPHPHLILIHAKKLFIAKIRILKIRRLLCSDSLISWNRDSPLSCKVMMPNVMYCIVKIANNHVMNSYDDHMLCMTRGSTGVDFCNCAEVVFFSDLFFLAWNFTEFHVQNSAEFRVKYYT